MTMNGVKNITAQQGAQLKHKCVTRLAECAVHPRFHVVAGFRSGWVVYEKPAYYCDYLYFLTFEEAINYAQREAKRNAQREVKRNVQMSLATLREENAAAVANIPEWRLQIYREDMARGEALAREIMAYGYFDSDDLE